MERIVRCQECMFWRPWCVKYNNGTYKVMHDLSESVGTNEGVNYAPCCTYDNQFEYNVDKTVFRNSDDFCSRGVKFK